MPTSVAHCDDQLLDEGFDVTHLPKHVSAGRKALIGLGLMAVTSATGLVMANPASAWTNTSCSSTHHNLRLTEYTNYTGQCGEEPGGYSLTSTLGNKYSDAKEVCYQTQSALNDNVVTLGVVLWSGTGQSGTTKTLYAGQSSGGIGYIGVCSIQWWNN